MLNSIRLAAFSIVAAFACPTSANAEDVNVIYSLAVGRNDAKTIQVVKLPKIDGTIAEGLGPMRPMEEPLFAVRGYAIGSKFLNRKITADYAELTKMVVAAKKQAHCTGTIDGSTRGVYGDADFKTLTIIGVGPDRSSLVNNTLNSPLTWSVRGGETKVDCKDVASPR